MTTIQIIKLLRIAFAFGLVESKNIVDYYIHNHMHDAPLGRADYSAHDVGVIMWIGAKIANEQWTLENGKLTTKVPVDPELYLDFKL